MVDLWKRNEPRLFWQFQPDLPIALWETAITKALPILGLPESASRIDTYLEQTLGEGQFGADHWQLSPVRRMYYFIKPILPRAIINGIKQISARRPKENRFLLTWPIEDRYARFMWEAARQVLILADETEIGFRSFWPDRKRFAFVLTHDVEGEKGLLFVEKLADLEESLGFHSSFNFVPRGYQIPPGLLQRLRDRGFEVGIHGLKHDGKLFNSRSSFMRQANEINSHLKALNAKGFRSPLMHRQPEWMQALNVEYDLSFFDTDPYEPLPGGTMSIWPFFLGHFIELPYTLVQDSTLMQVLEQNSPRIWLEKIDFLADYSAMALANSHPDYLCETQYFGIYEEFLKTVRDRTDYWHALPGEVAAWWKERADGLDRSANELSRKGLLSLQENRLVIAEP